MLNSDKPYDHWLRVDALVKRWLNQRQTLIVLMLALHEKNAAATAHPYARHSIRIQAFCQILVDYVSAGHFEIYDQLLAEAEQTGNPDGIREAQQLYPRLQRSTDAAVRFNDIYDSPEHTTSLLESLPQELNELGLLLERRFEQEDLLIARLHGSPALTQPPLPQAEAPGW
jgi:regulator of sigma D